MRRPHVRRRGGGVSVPDRGAVGLLRALGRRGAVPALFGDVPGEDRGRGRRADERDGRTAGTAETGVLRSPTGDHGAEPAPAFSSRPSRRRRRAALKIVPLSRPPMARVAYAGQSGTSKASAKKARPNRYSRPQKQLPMTKNDCPVTTAQSE